MVAEPRRNPEHTDKSPRYARATASLESRDIIPALTLNEPVDLTHSLRHRLKYIHHRSCTPLRFHLKYAHDYVASNTQNPHHPNPRLTPLSIVAVIMSGWGLNWFAGSGAKSKDAPKKAILHLRGQISISPMITKYRIILIGLVFN